MTKAKIKKIEGKKSPVGIFPTTEGLIITVKDDEGGGQKEIHVAVDRNKKTIEIKSLIPMETTKQYEKGCFKLSIKF